MVFYRKGLFLINNTTKDKTNLDSYTEFVSNKGMKMRYFKIYTRDKYGRQIIRLLHTSKKYTEVRQKYNRCEELFDNEVERMKAAGVLEIKD